MKITKKDILWLLSPLIIVLYTCLHILFINIGEATLIEIVPILCLSLLAGIVVILLIKFLLKDNRKVVFLSSIIFIICANFKSLELYLNKIIPWYEILYWHLLLIVIFIIFNLIIILKSYTLKELININKVIISVFIILLVSDIVFSIPKYANLINNLNTIETTSTIERGKELTEKPNFYYLIFDEYGGYENLKYFMNFSNDEFYNLLKEKKVNVSYSSRNKDIMTMKVVADLVNLKNITTDEITYLESVKLRENPPLVNLFKQHGYKFNKLTNDPIGEKSLPDYQVKIVKTTLDTPAGIILQETIFYPFIIKKSDKYHNNMLRLLSYLNESVGLEKNGLLSIAHFNLPHLPFIFNENGEKNPPYMYQELENEQIYLNQLKYVNKVIGNFIDLIRKKDPGAVVLIQSDHGCRLVLQRNTYLGQRKPTKEEIEYMKSVLNILYYKGEKVNIEGLSGYETLNLVVNKILGLNMVNK